MAEIGDRIGPFELIELLSSGRLSSVYRGVRVDGSSRQPGEVTLRVAAAGPDGPTVDGLAAVRSEYETLRVLQDERIPQAFALYGGHGASATSWVHGASLRDTLKLVEAGRLDLDAATSLDILVELAYALRHAHAIVRDEGRIVHGALAPEVVWLTAEGHVRLLGCGDPEPAHARPLAPEQQQGVQEPRTDQWLLGALGIELLRHAPEVLDAARGASVEVAYGLLQAQWPAATRVLARMLAESPSERYDAEERLIKDLLAVARHLGGASRRAEVGARSLQLLPTVRGEDAPPMPVGPLLQRRRDEPPRIQPGVPPIRPAGIPLPRPLGIPLGPATPGPAAGGSASTGPLPTGPGPAPGPVVAAPPRLHPSAPPRIPIDAAPPRILPDEPPGMEEVVAYTEETPLPFKPRGPAPLPDEPLFRADAEPTMMELGPLAGGPAVRGGWTPSADAEATEIYQPRLHGVTLEPEAPAADAWREEPVPSLDPVVEADSAADAPGEPPAVPFRTPTPRVEDPVPDQWVMGALVVFAVIAVLAVVWKLTST